jgi:ubiquinone/menaquinone biosynthesis C-methylase UbiE
MSKNNLKSLCGKIGIFGNLLIILSITLIIVILFNLFFSSSPISKEGFEQKDKVVIKEGEAVYDDFYVSVYDNLSFSELKNEFEVGEIINSTKPTSESKILDIGSGTGHHVSLFADRDIPTMGVDVSNFMVSKAKDTYPSEKFIKGDANNSSLFSPNSFTHITCLYFGIYYFKDKTIFFNNCMKWLMPGGYLVVHIVDRDRFDPILPPANPLLLISPQKYSDKRITKSEVIFNNMQYKANFDMSPDTNIAIFNERFEGNDNKIRKNKHVFTMEPEKNIVTMAKQAGFLVHAKIDMVKVGYEYQYLYVFVKPN